MIPCKHCNTPNSLDSTFCKRCGTGLPEEDIASGKEKLDKIVQEGITALSEGRISEAMAIAESAVSSDPSSVSAFALKSAAHERLGEIAQALECAERIVELNPDSELDKIKRNQLRASLAENAVRYRAPSRSVLVTATVSAMAIVACAGILGFKFLNHRPSESRVALNTNRTESPSTPTIGPAAQTQPQITTPVEAATPGQQQAAPQNNQAGGGGGVVNLSRSAERPSDGGSSSRSSKAGSLPTIDDNSVEVKPITPPAPPTSITPTKSPVSKVAKGNSGDPPPTPDLPKSAPAQLAANDPGQIDIRVHSSGSRTPSTGDTPRDTSKMYLRMGNDYYQMGNYSGAAASLEKAVTSGADPVSANQRLGQSYHSLGRKAEAAEAYRKAISAANADISAGRGNSTRLRVIRDACETALKQMQG